MSTQLTLTGRLGADPELRVASNGSMLATWRMATNGRRLVEGNWEDTDTTWWHVTAFGKVAEAVVEGARKGDLVIVTGKAKENSWDKDGVKHSRIEVIADQVAKVLKVGAPPVDGAVQSAGWGESGPF